MGIMGPMDAATIAAIWLNCAIFWGSSGVPPPIGPIGPNPDAMAIMAICCGSIGEGEKPWDKH